MKYIMPASFDPIHFGHLDIINKIANITGIDNIVTVLVMNSDSKKHMFDIDERVKMVRNTLKNICHYSMFIVFLVT